MRKILISLGVIGAVAAIVIGATVAYFSDTETSSGNTITAGVLDLQLQCPAGPTPGSANLNPNYGYDTTWYLGPYTLTGDDLSTLATSNDVRYTTKGMWYEETYQVGEYLEFRFPDIPAGATVDSVVLKFEWRRALTVDQARLQIYDGSWLLTYYDLPLPSPLTDDIVTIDLKTDYGINTATKVDALRIKFQATDGSGAYTYHDWVQVDVGYTLPGTPNWCDTGLTGTFVVSNVYPGQTGSPATISYRNNGSIGGVLKMKVTNLVNNENVCVAPELLTGLPLLPDTSCDPDQGELGEYLELIVNGTPSGTLNLLASGPGINLGALAANTAGLVTLSWQLPSGTGNIVQSDGVAFTLEFILEQ